MPIIRVNPASVQAYGAAAQRIFEEIHQSLVGLVNEVVSVRYFGPNAVAFKAECGQLASEFANRLSADMSAMADAVRASTTNIAASLGGAPIAIALNPQSIVPPIPPSVDYVDVDTAALEGVIPTVGQRFATIEAGLANNLSQLRSTDWQGHAKLAAVETVGGFTSAAQGRCDAARRQITTYVRNQIDAVVMADR